VSIHSNMLTIHSFFSSSPRKLFLAAFEVSSGVLHSWFLNEGQVLNPTQTAEYLLWNHLFAISNLIKIGRNKFHTSFSLLFCCNLNLNSSLTFNVWIRCLLATGSRNEVFSTGTTGSNVEPVEPNEKPRDFWRLWFLLTYVCFPLK
jgi:hypothetical protein